MARLEEMTIGARAPAIVPGVVAMIESVFWIGNQVIIFENAGGRFDRKVLFRDDEHELDPGRHRRFQVRVAPASVAPAGAGTATLSVWQEMVQAQLDKEGADQDASAAGPRTSTRGSIGRTPPPSSTPPPAPGGDATCAPRPLTTHVATARLDATRLGHDAGKIIEETIQHVSVLSGTEVDIRLKMHIRGSGSIGDRVVHIMSENAHALGLVSSNFEKD